MQLLSLSWIANNSLFLTTWPPFLLVWEWWLGKKITSCLLAWAKHFIWSLLMMYLVSFYWTMTTFLLTLFVDIEQAILLLRISILLLLSNLFLALISKIWKALLFYCFIFWVNVMIKVKWFHMVLSWNSSVMIVSSQSGFPIIGGN